MAQQPPRIPIPALLAAAVAVAFAPCLLNGFVDWDDSENFLVNYSFRGLGWPRIRWAWQTALLGVYQPLSWMLFEAEYTLWGMAPWGYHLASIIFHIINTIIFYILAISLLRRAGLEGSDPGRVARSAGLAAALFAVHPLRVEVVAWASCQPYLPCSLFAMLAVLAYLRALGGEPAGRRAWRVASLACFAAALASKAVATTVPAVLLILDVYPLRRLGPGRWFGKEARAAWIEKLPYVALSMAAVIMALRSRGEELADVPAEHRSGAARVAQAAYGAWFYPIKTAWPLDLVAYYPLPPRLSWTAPAYLAGLVGVAAFGVAAIVLRRRWPALLATWAAYLALLAPCSGLVYLGTQLAGDRYGYLATMPWFVLLAAGLERLSRRRAGDRALRRLGPALVAVLTALTWLQCTAWHDTESLWRHALRHGAAGSAEVNNNLAAELIRQERLREGLALAEEAIRLDPRYARSYSTLASGLQRLGRLDEAIDRYAEALRLDPDIAEAHYNLGLALTDRGDLDRALDELSEAVAINPHYAEAYNGRGVALARRQELDAAVPEFRRALAIKPDFFEAHANLGRALLRLGDRAEALDHLAAAVRLRPDDARTRAALAEAVGARRP